MRTLLLKDVSTAYVEGINDPEVYRYLLLADKGRQTIRSIKKYVRANLDSGTAILFGIFLPAGELIGTIRLSGISYYHYCCDVGICLFAKEHWNKGYAAEALDKVVSFIFDTLGLHYIEAGVFTENASSVNLFLKAGFVIRCVYGDKLRLNNHFAEVTILCRINTRFDFNKLMR